MSLCDRAHYTFSWILYWISFDAPLGFIVKLWITNRPAKFQFRCYYTGYITIIFFLFLLPTSQTLSVQIIFRQTPRALPCNNLYQPVSSTHHHFSVNFSKTKHAPSSLPRSTSLIYILRHYNLSYNTTSIILSIYYSIGSFYNNMLMVFVLIIKKKKKRNAEDRGLRMKGHGRRGHIAAS